MYFEPSEYTKNVKLGTRLNFGEALKFIEQFPAEKKLLEENDQFKHILHMPVEPNNQFQGMWMLMVRTIRTKVKRECWFVVNGRLIRYTIKEHALLTGLNCKDLPANWKKIGSLDFAKRVLKKTKSIKISDVVKKLESMKTRTSGDRMKLVVLYFLAKVLVVKTKYDASIDEFLLRVVDDLSICERFPWGTFTFNDCADSIKGLVDGMKGVAKQQPQISGFIIPPQIFPFECIPNLRRRFREDVQADPGCPRMCKSKFVKPDGKGVSMDEIYEALGDTKDIISILEPTEAEVPMMRRILEDNVDDGLGHIDVVVDSWRERLLIERKPIFWESWHKKNVDSRAKLLLEDVTLEDREEEDVAEKENVDFNLQTLKEIEDKLMKEIQKGFETVLKSVGEMNEKVVEKVNVLEKKVEYLENFVKRRRVVVSGSGGCSGEDYLLMSTPPLSPVEEEDGNRGEKEQEQEKEDGNKGEKEQEQEIGDGKEGEIEKEQENEDGNKGEKDKDDGDKEEEKGEDEGKEQEKKKKKLKKKKKEKKSREIKKEKDDEEKIEAEDEEDKEENEEEKKEAGKHGKRTAGLLNKDDILPSNVKRPKKLPKKWSP